MKKILLSVGLALLASIGSAQVICYVEAPSPNEGNYDNTYATSADAWGVADLNIPANSVQGNMVFCDDGTAADSLACNPLINGAQISGNIAVLYRGTCQFGVKALNAQNAGAIGVIIINNQPGALNIIMQGGTDGPSVTIPVVMITDVAGALLKSEITAGLSPAFIGNKLGLYGDDLGIYPQHMLIPEQFGNIQALSQNGTEFSAQMGSWVINYGSNAQTNVVLNATVMLGATVLYDETSAPVASIPSGDSAFISLPLFSNATYANGYYDILYTTTSAAPDEIIFDNDIEAHFIMSDSIYAYSRVDETTFKPVSSSYLRSNTTGLITHQACLEFTDPNASRVAIKGLTFSGVSDQNPDTTTMDGLYVETFVYEWNDGFADINTAAFSAVDEVATGEYFYLSDLQGDDIFVPFITPILLVDNQRYLFCVKHKDLIMYVGYDAEMDYNWNLNTYLQPQFPGEVNGTWNKFAFGTDYVPAITAHMFTAQVGLVELPKSDLVAYPNPASEIINIPLGKVEGNVSISITDINGRLVSTQNSAACSSSLTVDVTSLPVGIYTLKLTYENGTSEAIKVVVNR